MREYLLVAGQHPVMSGTLEIVCMYVYMVVQSIVPERVLPPYLYSSS